MKKILDYLFNSRKPHWSIVLEGRFIYGGDMTRREALFYAAVYMEGETEIVYKHEEKNG